MLGETRLDSYIASRYRRPAGDPPVRHVQSTCLGKSLPYLAPRRLLFLKDSSIHIIYPIVPSIGLPIHILTLQKLTTILRSRDKIKRLIILNLNVGKQYSTNTITSRRQLLIFGLQRILYNIKRLN